MFWDNWEHADRFRASKKEVCVSVFLFLPGMLCVLVWGAIFSLDAPLLKYGITDPASTSPSFCTNFSCPSVTTPAGKSVWSLEHPAGSVKQGGRETRLKGLSLFKSKGEGNEGRSESAATENLPGRALL